MKVFRTLAELAATNRPVSLAIGVFDGVHLGHQRVLNQARAACPADGLAVALTFDPHPLRVLRPDQAPPLLTSTAHKLALIEQLGLDACVLIHFDNAFATITAEQFIAQIAFCRHICVGTRFHFGHNRTGNSVFLEQLAPRYGFTVTEIKPVRTPAGEMISSTAVRQHIFDGNLDRAAVMLGRPFSIRGTVVKGDGIGHQLGYPTANINPALSGADSQYVYPASGGEAFPPDGVYLTRVIVAGGESVTGVINLGRRPTFTDRSHQRILEVHLLDFRRDIYGQELEVIFRQKLRGEQKFADVTALKRQIAADIATARQLTPA